MVHCVEIISYAPANAYDNTQLLSSCLSLRVCIIFPTCRMPTYLHRISLPQSLSHCPKSLQQSHTQTAPSNMQRRRVESIPAMTGCNESLSLEWPAVVVVDMPPWGESPGGRSFFLEKLIKKPCREGCFESTHPPLYLTITLSLDCWERRLYGAQEGQRRT